MPRALWQQQQAVGKRRQDGKWTGALDDIGWKVRHDVESLLRRRKGNRGREAGRQAQISTSLLAGKSFTSERSLAGTAVISVIQPLLQTPIRKSYRQSCGRIIVRTLTGGNLKSSSTSRYRQCGRRAPASSYHYPQHALGSHCHQTPQLQNMPLCSSTKSQLQQIGCRI